MTKSSNASSSKSSTKPKKRRTSTKKITSPKSKSSIMERFKMEAAREVGVTLKPGYNGNLTARQAGAIGGRMVKKIIDSYKKSHK